MNKKLLAIIVTVAAAAIIAIVVVSNRKDDSSTASTTTGSQSDDSNLMKTSDSAMPMPPPASSSGSSSGGTAVEASKVTIENYAYAPAKIKVKKGTTVTWTNQDSVKHDVAPDEDYGDAFKAGDLLGKGESYSFTFNTVGNYSYHCSPHPYMKASVEVVE